MRHPPTTRDGGPSRSERAASPRRERDALHATAVALSQPLDADALFELIVERAAPLVDGARGFVYVLAPDRTRLVQRVSQAPAAPYVGDEVPLDVGVGGLVARTGRSHIDNDYKRSKHRRELGEAMPAAVLGVPLFASGDLVGVLGLTKMKDGSTFSDDDLRLVERFAQLASLALERVRLHGELQAELAQRRDTEEELLHAIARLSSSELALKHSHEEMVRRLAAAAEQRDGATGRHIERMSETCERIARELGLDDAYCESIRLASPLHDVGKIAVPDQVLLKPGPLDDDERAVIERHAEIGYRMLHGSGSELLELAASIALTHHERFDGRGYPQRLAGADIPLEGRIAAVADVYDALTADRVYRPAFGRDRAIGLLREGRGTQFDPVVLDAFLAAEGASPNSVAPSGAARASGVPHDPAPGLPGSRTVSWEALLRAGSEAAHCLTVAAEGREAIDEALKRLCRSAGDGVIASVYALEHDRLWCIAQCGYDQVRDGFTLEQGVMGRALRTRCVEFLADVRGDPNFVAALPGIASELAIPLVGARARAVLNVETVDVVLPPTAATALEPFAAAMTEHIDILNAGLRLDLATLARLVVYASSLRSVAALSEFATRTLGRLLDLEAAQLTLGGSAGADAASFWRRPESPLLPLSGETVAAVTARSSLSEFTFSVIDGTTMDMTTPDEPGRWLLWLPLRVRGALIGTLVGRSSAPTALGHEQTEAAMLFAQQLAALIDVGQALRREQRAAVTDSLTGLLNRRGFDERLRDEIARADRSGTPLALVLVDCDDLKRINDRLGHEAGDAMLQDLARLLRRSKRVSDVAARVGGDEFALVLPEADGAAAATLAERIRSTLSARGPAGSGTTASFGIATYPDDGHTCSALLRAADRSLYDEAKRRGKNRVGRRRGARA